jgi:hypothetical protein
MEVQVIGMWIIAPAVIVVIVLQPKLLEIIIGSKRPDYRTMDSESDPPQNDPIE